MVILDLAGADLPALEVVRRMAAAAPLAKVIGLSLHGDRRFVAEFLKAGAFGYLLKERSLKSWPRLSGRSRPGRFFSA